MPLAISKEPSTWVIKSVKPQGLSDQEKRAIMHLTNQIFGFEDCLEVLRLLNKTTSVAFLCLKNDSRELLGWVIAKRKTRVVEVAYIAVDPRANETYRRRGAGTLLMAKIFKFARQAQLSVVLEFNALHKRSCCFYASFDPVKQDTRNYLQLLALPHLARPEFDPKASLAAISKRSFNSCGTRKFVKGRCSGRKWHLIKQMHTVLWISVFVLGLTLFCRTPGNPIL